MSGPVDVMAVWSDAIDHMHALGGCFVNQDDDDAHSDLIEQAKGAREATEYALSALRLAERTIARYLAATGYQPGTCTDEWAPEVRTLVVSLVPIRAALARCGVSS